MNRREKQLGKPGKRRADPDVTAVMANNPIVAWRAGWSLMLSLFSVALLGATALISVLKTAVELGVDEFGTVDLDLVEPGVRVAASVGLYGFFWLAGLMYGAGEAAEGSMEAEEAYRGAFVMRVALAVLGYALLLWCDDSRLWAGGAVLSAGLWMGAFLESACVGHVARERGFSIRKAAVVSFRVAGRGGRQAFGVVEVAERDV